MRYDSRIAAACVALFVAYSLPGCATVSLPGCATVPASPLPTVSQVDLPRFMGDWYVIACIPTFIEKDAYAARESYTLAPDGTVATTFTFRKGGFDGPIKTYHPRGFIRDPSNAVWGMQFVWPIKAEYRIAYLAPDYSATVIARSARDYVWIMARSATLEPAQYERLRGLVAGLGYDVARLRLVPQRAP